MKKIGIIGAMEIEVETLKSHMEIKRTVEKASMVFEEGVLNGVDVVVVRSGVGKVNAGICVQILADLFDVTHIINTGVAGSLDAAINIGDIVVSTDVMYHDVDATIFGYDLGEVPQLGVKSFVADQSMVKKTMEALQITAKEECAGYEGRVLSGDQFVASDDVKTRLVNQFKGSCTEMEGCAIAHASYLNHIPFVIIRAISDKADHSAEVDYPSFEKKAAGISAKLVEYLITTI